MQSITPLRKELKEIFLQEFTLSEKAFFLRKAQESIEVNGYPAGEDLFFYCYFLAQKERLRSLGTSGAGYMRVMLVEGVRDVEDMVRMYRERLEKNNISKSDIADRTFLEFFSESTQPPSTHDVE